MTRLANTINAFLSMPDWVVVSTYVLATFGVMTVGAYFGGKLL